MDEEVCSALEAAEEARALLPALLSAFDNHQVGFTYDEMMRLVRIAENADEKAKVQLRTALLSAFDNHQVFPALQSKL